MTSHAELLERLYARGHRGIELGLDRVRRAARALGDPHLGVRALHVAGTNGKGSVAAMLDAIARESGLRAGLYTSPHLVALRERIRVDGAPLDDAQLDDALARVFRDAPAELTFFETLTLAAFVAFREAKIDLAVLEVGLGGRLDATNLVEAPLATGVVSIARGDDGRDLEHAALLGDSVDAIAREKAGIAKAGAPLVVGPVDPVAREAILDVARARGASPVWSVGADLRVDGEGEEVCLVLPEGERVVLAPRLGGAHQIENAAVAAGMAVLAARSEARIGRASIERGIARAAWDGRMETVVARGRTFLLDCAHNVDGARALAAAVSAQGIPPDRTILVFGALADKAWSSMLRVLAPLATRRVYTSPSGRAPAPLEALAATAPGAGFTDVGQALDAAVADASTNDTILVCGSIYLVGEVRARLLDLPRDPVIAL